MIFEEKSFYCYILLPDQISLSGCLYFVRYWAIISHKAFDKTKIDLELVSLPHFLYDF